MTENNVSMLFNVILVKLRSDVKMIERNLQFNIVVIILYLKLRSDITRN